VGSNELHLSYTTQDTVEIFRMADGKQTELLTVVESGRDPRDVFNTFHVDEVVWSPDSTMIAVLRHRKVDIRVEPTVSGWWVEVLNARRMPDCSV